MTEQKVPGSFDPDVRYAALDERVQNQGLRLNQIEAAMSRGFQAVENSISGLSTEFRSNNKPQWQALSLLATVIIAVLGFTGTILYMPIKGDISELKGNIAELAKVSVGKADLEYRLNVSAQRRDDFQRMSEARDMDLSRSVDDLQKNVVPRAEIDTLREKIVPRGEHEQIWKGFTDRQQELQRQIEEMKRFQTGLVSAPDYLKGLDERLRLIEMKNLRP